MVCGIDLGSRMVKLVFHKGNTFSTQRYNTIEFYRNYGNIKDGKLSLDLDKLELPRFEKIVASGYGRLALNIQGVASVPEIKAHVEGATHQTGLQDFTLLDIGGQDSKVAKVRNRNIIDFQTNDKCAASTGRYLENMARVLGISVEEMGNYQESPVNLSSTCAIFGESELIGKIVEGYCTSELAAGVNMSIFSRVHPLLKRLMSKDIVFTGGVAHNEALREIISRELEVNVIVPEFSLFNGAIGCYVIAEKTKTKRDER